MGLEAKILVFGFLMLYCFRAYPVTVGADSLVSVEPATTFPAASTSNQILQFAFMQNGFSFADATISCTFGAAFPVAGTISLRGGTLYLNTDLLFQNPANLLSTGYVWGNNHQVDLSQSITWLPATFQSAFRDTSIFLNNDFTIAGTVKFLGTCLLDGRWNNVALGQGANLIIGHNAKLTLRNMELNYLLGYKIKCLDDSASLVLDNVRWAQSGDYTFTRGSILFLDEVYVSGQYVFNFSPTLTSTIGTDSMLYFDMGTKFCYSPAVPKRTLLFMNDSTSRLYLNGCSLVATRTGLDLVQGSLIIDNAVTFSSQAHFSIEGIRLKDTLNTIICGGGALNLFGNIIFN